MNQTPNHPSGANEEHEQSPSAKIARLNDRLRQTGQGGQLMVTNGVMAMGEETVRSVYEAVQRFNQFTPDNDPYGEHDFGSVEVEGAKIFWKIDYYAKGSYQYGSEDPSNPDMTNRVMTIMLAEEY